MNIDTIKAVIFDMDGLMLDTERIAWEIFNTGCQVHQFKPSPEVFHSTIGTDGPTTWSILEQGYGPGFPARQIQAYFQHHYPLRIQDSPIPVKKGLFPLLLLLTRLKIKLAVGTTTGREMTYLKLKNSNLTHFFTSIITGDDVQRRKPYPDIFLKAATDLGEETAHCLILEDSDNGVRAALAAGIAVIQIPDLQKPTKEIRDCGHLILESLNQVADIFREKKAPPAPLLSG